jgi:hypothetical protein
MKNVVKNATDAGQTPLRGRPAFPGLARELACLLHAVACFFLSCRSGREATEGSRRRREVCQRLCYRTRAERLEYLAGL